MKKDMVRYCIITALVVSVALGSCAVALNKCVVMPGKSFAGPRPAAAEELKQIEAALRKDLITLSVDIGERSNATPEKLAESANFIQEAMKETGCAVALQKFGWQDSDYVNLELTVPGQSPDLIVIGAHYDSVIGCPGANDNGTGVVALLELARYFAKHPQRCTLKFVAFPNEEYYFRTEGMGSCLYSALLQKHGQLKKVKGMIALETIGYFSDKPGSQTCPAPFASLYPDTGNFISFISTDKSLDFVRTCVGSFRNSGVPLPSEGLGAPAEVPGVDWSDHLYFLKHNVPALMVTDTAPYRYPYYHKAEDTIDKLDLAGTALVVQGMKTVIADLASK